MIAMLLQRRLELGEQLLGDIGWVSAAPQPGDNLLLPRYMPFALRDMVFNHS